MNRIYSCSEKLLIQVFAQAGIDSSDLASEYRLTESARLKHKSFKSYILTEEDLDRLTLSLWERNRGVAIGFIYTLGFNAGIRSENHEKTEIGLKKGKIKKPSNFFGAFMDFLKFPV